MYKAGIRNDAAKKNAEILRRCGNSDVLSVLKKSIKGYSIYGLYEQETLYHKLNYRNNYGILTSLTRGQFQNFLLDTEISMKAKLSLLQSEEYRWDDKEKNPLLETNKEAIAALYADEDYGEILSLYDEFMDNEFDAAKKMCEVYDEIKDSLQLEDKVIIDGIDIEEYESAIDEIHYYEAGNLYKILSEPNLAQRNKWLQEITEIGDFDDVEYNDALYMDEHSRRYIYYMLKEATTRKFYRSIGIDYDEVGPNGMVPETVDFGVEIEEIGVDSCLCEVRGFDSCHDISLCDYDLMTDKRIPETSTGEYQTSVLSTDYGPDYEKLEEQINILNYYGARTNQTCGCHIHVSTAYTEKYELNPDSEDYDNNKHRAQNLQKEIYEMQTILGDKFKLFENRELEACSYLSSPEFDDLQLDKFQFVNMSSLEKGEGIEFRFFNLPFAIDKKVIDAYCDFITNYMLYIDEGNNTTEYFEEAVAEVDSIKRTRRSDDELKFDILKQQLCLKDSTMKVLEHMDEIYEFHNVGDVITNAGEHLNYFAKYNRPILEEDEEINEMEQ